MKEHAINVNSAKKMCRKIINEHVSEYRRVLESSKEDTSLTLGQQRLIEVMQYSLKGNAVWSLVCPRYNRDAEYNSLQLSMMNNGIEEVLKSSPKHQHIYEKGFKH